MKHKRRLKKKWLYCLIGIIVISILFVVTNIIFCGKVTFSLSGLEIEIVKVNNKYIDNGVIALKNGEQLDNNRYKVISNSNVDITRLGTYEIQYKIEYKKENYELKRTVIVVDDEAPTIDTNIDSIERDYCSNKETINFKYTIKDNYDNDLSSNTKITEENNNLTITVSDTSGNTSTKTIPITYINKPSGEESISIKGTEYVYVALNKTYKELGATISSKCSNNTNRVVIDNQVDTTKIGDYTIKYSIQNNSNKSVTRKVKVYEPNIKTSTNKDSEKTIYLTFDDGPCAYTPRVLKTLKKYNVKATFFVTNQFPSYVHLIKEEYEAGHAIGVHTYTHNYNIYRSIETYEDDFNKMNSVIEKYTNQKSQIFRFPGGVSNTISTNYSVGIMRALATHMSNEGYAYFDWNVSSGDASSASSAKIYKNITNGILSCTSCVVLMHDIQYNTVNILDDVLNELTSRGYKFDTLKIDSPTCHHGIAN